MSAISKLIEIATAELGYLGKKSNAQLDSKTANTSGKFTKYARDAKTAGFYGGSNKQGFDYCTVFVAWCVLQTCNGNRELAEKVLVHTNKYAASCKYASQYYKQKNRLFKVPLVGDQFFLKPSASAIYPSHTGIVYKVDGTKVYTIEGNTSVGGKSGVAKREYLLSNSRIYGYGRPQYELIKDEEPDRKDEEPKAEDKLQVTAYKPKAEYNGNYTVSKSVGLNLRLGADTTYKSLGLYKAGTVVRCYGYYNVRKTNGNVWLLVTVDGKQGYMALSGLKKK